MDYSVAQRVYRNEGNRDVVDLIDPTAKRVLDVGCGAGDNGALMRSRQTTDQLDGITGSRQEAALAVEVFDRVWQCDLEQGLPPEMNGQTYDAMLFSHVLEHVRQPAELLGTLLPYLNPHGVLAIAVPNVMFWRQRVDFMLGKFEYTESGILDSTHLRFFTFETAVPLLFSSLPEFAIESVHVTGYAPQWLFRRSAKAAPLSRRLDRWASRRRPNLFGSQILIKARLR